MKVKFFKSVSVKLLMVSVVLVSLFALSSCNMKANKGYKNAIEQADNFFNNKKYVEAKSSYEEAIGFKPEEQYPQQCVSKIDIILKKKKIEKDYTTAIKLGDQQFADKDYANAKSNFEKAVKLKKNQPHPQEMIEKINVILDEIARQEEMNKYPYHIIVGCFEVELNSTNLNQKLLQDGNESRIIPILNGKYNAVSVASYPDLTSAYNHIAQVKSTFGEEVWVLEQ